MWNIMALMELNYPGQIIDKEVFDKMMKEWAERKRVKAEEEPSDEAPNMIVSSGVPVVDTEFKQKLQKILPLARHAVANEIREKHKEAVESFLTDHNVVKSTDDYHLVDGKFMPTSEVADRVFEDEVYGGGHDTGFAD